jgi:hypothetical protein
MDTNTADKLLIDLVINHMIAFMKVKLPSNKLELQVLFGSLSYNALILYKKSNKNSMAETIKKKPKT